MTQPLVSIVILNWNGGTDTLRCVEHALAQTYRPVEVLVVDNGSTDGSLALLGSRLASVRTMLNPENRGFAAGMNQGIEATRGPYVILLNQDALLDREFVARAVSAAATEPVALGMIAGGIFRLDGAIKTAHLSGGATALGGRIRLLVDQRTEEAHWAFAPTWCCPFLSRAMLDDVRSATGHWFDERYFAYGEDLDLSLRAQLRGWRCLFVPEIKAWHAQSGSQGGRVRLLQKPPQLRTIALRNRYFTIVKDLPAALWILLLPLLLGVEILAWPYFLIRSPATLLCLVRAQIQALGALPENLRLRRRVQVSRTVRWTSLLRHFQGL